MNPNQISILHQQNQVIKFHPKSVPLINFDSNTIIYQYFPLSPQDFTNDSRNKLVIFNQHIIFILFPVSMYTKKLERFLEKPIGISPKRSPSKQLSKKDTTKNSDSKKSSYFLQPYSSTTKTIGMGKSQIESYIHERKLGKKQYKTALNESDQRRFSKLDYKKPIEADRKNTLMHRSTISDLRKYDNLLQKISKSKLYEISKSPAPRKKETQTSHIRLTKPSSFELEYKQVIQSVSTLENTRRLEKYKNNYPFYDLFKKVEIEDFEFVKKIGNGKFSEVYLVKDKRTQFMAALKIIRKSQLSSMKMINQFVREIKIHSYVRHPNIVNLYSAFYDDGNVYLLQQFCNGGQLFKQLQKVGTFSEKAVSFIIRNILDAVSYLHSENILHRDIKPQNIIIIHGNVKICDFGWAVYEPNKLRETLCGTPIYTCPELVKGQKYSDKIDLWTIGMLTYELYFGHIPFRIEEQQDLSKIATDQITFPSNSKASRQFEDFVLQLLKKDPRQRLTADILLGHPFIQKYKKVEVCEELCFS